jgi:hypothetical protein
LQDSLAFWHAGAAGRSAPARGNCRPNRMHAAVPRMVAMLLKHTHLLIGYTVENTPQKWKSPVFYR